MPSFSPYPVNLGGAANLSVVVRFDRTQSGSNRFSLLPNLKCEGYEIRTGAVLPTARFSYVLDSDDPSNVAPYLFEQLWPINVSGRYVVQPDDELIVYEFDEAGDRMLDFDGFAQVPQVNQGAGLATTFVATGVHCRLWDTPIGPAWYRDTDLPQTGAAVTTNLPTWFNPNGRPNRTPTGYDVNNGATNSYPLFLDPKLTPAPSAPHPAPVFWSLPDLVQYMAWTCNPGQAWVNNPVAYNGVSLYDYLQSVTPLAGQDYMDLTDPSTYQVNPIFLRSFDATGHAWPEVVAQHLKYYGFEWFFNTREDPSDPGAPINEIILYRVDGRDAVAPKTLYYPPQNALATDGLPDFSGIALVRDHFKPANAIDIQSDEIGVEVSIVLACGFSPDPADAADAEATAFFSESALTNAPSATRMKYRFFHFDECGFGHWDQPTSTWIAATPTSLNSVFGSPSGGSRSYVHRFRTGAHQLFSTDDVGRPRKAELAVSSDYTGASPGVWDGTGTWRSLGQSGWKLDDTMLGVWLTVDNPESWRLPVSDVLIGAGDVIPIVTSLATPSTNHPWFYLRLTTAIKSDVGLAVSANKRAASPMKYNVRRRIDCRDHWTGQIIHPSSIYNTTGKPISFRDDTPMAQAQANAMREADEMPPIAGTITVPWLCHTVGVGDMLSAITGRNVSLASNAGATNVQTPRYPAVIGASFSLQKPQSTVFHMSDRRAEPEAASHGLPAIHRGRH